MSAAGRRAQPLLDPALQAASFDRTRSDHRTEIAEDYVELIADLIEATGEARAVDLAARLGVSNPTVANTIGRLLRDGLVTSEPYRAIFLTEQGWAMARHCRRRHRIVLDFLLALGVEKSVAATDTEGIEHHVSTVTLQAIERWLDRHRPARPGEADGAAMRLER